MKDEIRKFCGEKLSKTRIVNKKNVIFLEY